MDLHPSIFELLTCVVDNLSQSPYRTMPFKKATYLLIVYVPSEDRLWLRFSGCAIKTQDISNLVLLLFAIDYRAGGGQICW